MLHSDSYRRQLKLVGPVLMPVFGVGILILFTIGLLRVLFGVDIGELTRDPIHKTGLHPFIGFLSNIGVLMWSFTAAVCLFTAFVLRRSNSSRSVSLFFFFAGLLTTWLMLDDLFLFHDVIFREYLGISEIVVYPIYMGGTALFVYHFREQIRRSDFVILVISVGFFTLSLMTDVVSDRAFASEGIPGGYLFEDGFKFLGIASWLAYFSRTSFLNIMGVAGTRRARMSDGICPRCGSSRVEIMKNQAPVDVAGVPLAAVHRYEQPTVVPLHNDQYSMNCDECGYSEFFLSEKMKLVAVKEEDRMNG